MEPVTFTKVELATGALIDRLRQHLTGKQIEDAFADLTQFSHDVTPDTLVMLYRLRNVTSCIDAWPSHWFKAEPDAP